VVIGIAFLKSVSAARWIGIAAVAVAAGDATVPVMDPQLCALTAADLSGLVDGLALGVMVAAGALAAAAFNVPATRRVVDDMVSVRTLSAIHEMLQLSE
jgi:hypothetical protein